MSKNSTFVCVLRHGYYPHDIRVYKEVRAMVDAGYSVDVICLRKPGEKKKEVVDSVRVYRIPLNHQRNNRLRYALEYGMSFLSMFALITLLFFRRKYRMIQVNTMPDFLVFVTILPKLCGTKILLDMHEPVPELWRTKYQQPADSRIIKLLIFIEQLAMRYADAVLTVNDTIKKRFAERGTPAEKITVIRNVPEESFFRVSSPVKLNGDLVIMTHGTIEPRYGHELVLKALVKIKEKIPSVKLMLIGNGENEQKVRQQIAEMGLQNDVTLKGWMPLNELTRHIAGAHLGIVPLMPSPFSELCQPNKLFDYIVLKKPVIVSRLPAIEESFDDSAVMFFEPGNYLDLVRCILEVYQNSQKNQERIQNAFKKYQELRWEVTKQHYLQVVNKLIV